MAIFKYFGRYLPNMPVKIGSIVKFYTILLLNEGHKYGYDLMKELEAKLGRRISASQVYPFLNVLEKNSILRVESIGEREKKVYSLTPRGREFVDSFLERFGDLLHAAIEPKLTVCTHCGCKVYEGMHTEVISGKKLAFCCCHCARTYKMAHAKKAKSRAAR